MGNLSAFFLAACISLEITTMGISPVGTDGAWISLPTFSTHRMDGAKQLPQIVDAIPSLRSKAFIVLDLRHNRCCATKWSRRITEELERYNGTLYLITDGCELPLPNAIRLDPPTQNQQALEDWVLANNLIYDR